LPPADTVWYEQRFDPKMSEFTEHGTHDGGGPNTWPSLFFQNSPPSSPPSLISDLGSSGSFERESQGSVVNIVVSQYIASGRCYDVYRGVAELQYEGYLDTVKVPIVAKYLDGEAEMPKAPGYDLYDDDERVVHVSSRSTRRTSNKFTDRASRLRTSPYSTSGNVMCFKFWGTPMQFHSFTESLKTQKLARGNIMAENVGWWWKTAAYRQTCPIPTFSTYDT
jgi:hypothetical protein